MNWGKFSNIVLNPQNINNKLLKSDQEQYSVSSITKKQTSTQSIAQSTTGNLSNRGQSNGQFLSNAISKAMKINIKDTKDSKDNKGKQERISRQKYHRKIKER